MTIENGRPFSNALNASLG